MTTRKIGAGSLERLMGGWQVEAGRLPTYRQIEQTLRLLILDGRLPIGIRLPGERNLAAELGVSRITVAAAYEELRERGFISSRHGSGSFTRLPRETNVPGSESVDFSGIDFSIAALPAPKEVHAAYAEALAALPRHLPGTGYEPAGLFGLRQAIADRYAQRGVPTSADEILVTQGAQHGLVLLLGLLARPGDRILVDHPTYSKALEAIRNASCQPVPVQMTETGWDLEQLSETLAQTLPRFAYLLPDFHNPTGHCMAADERRQVAAIMARAHCPLVIDETMVDLWFDAPPPPPMAAFGRSDQLITLGSMGKSVWGGLRIGWVRASPEIISGLASARAAVDMGSPIVEQLAATALLRDPEAMLAERREAVRGQRDHLMGLIRKQLPEWKFNVRPGGLSIWIEMPRPVSTALAATAHELGLRIAPGSRFGVDGAFERFVRLPYSLPPPVLTKAVDLLEQAWKLTMSAGSRRSPAVGATELTEAI